MEISYDKEADAMYIEFRKGDFAKNKKIDDFTIIDLDKKREYIRYRTSRSKQKNTY